LIRERGRDKTAAAHAAGCRTVWIDCCYRERGPSQPPDSIVGSIAEAADWIAACVEESAHSSASPHGSRWRLPAR
jgi:hypothetical protein